MGTVIVRKPFQICTTNAMTNTPFKLIKYQNTMTALYCKVAFLPGQARHLT
jgi:hypothetical protein